MTHPHSLCARVLSGKYDLNKDFLAATKKRNSSHTWRVILFGREALKIGLIKRVGDGASVNIWEDLWIPVNYVHPATTTASKVADLLLPDFSDWDHHKLEVNLCPADVQAVRCIPTGRFSEDFWA